MLEERMPAMAGTYYPADAPALRRQLAWCIEHPIGPGAVVVPEVRSRVYALVSPHAGYRYSGPVAANAFSLLKSAIVPDLVVVIGPNHHMLGAPVAVSGAKFWHTPLTTTKVDGEAAAELCADRLVAAIDDVAHELEHSVEVQLPFLQHMLEGQCKVLPIVMHDQELGTAQRLGQALGAMLKDRNAVVVASSDFTHYESQLSATEKDQHAIRAIEALDPVALFEAIEQHAISMCGPGPVITAIVASRALGATRGQLLRYVTSGQMSGDYTHVVGYGALALI